MDDWPTTVLTDRLGAPGLPLTTRIPEGARLKGIPETVSDGPPTESVEPARAITDGFGTALTVCCTGFTAEESTCCSDSVSEPTTRLAEPNDKWVPEMVIAAPPFDITDSAIKTPSGVLEEAFSLGRFC